jgi:hypothetical protein
MEWEVTVRHVLPAVACHSGMRGDSATCVTVACHSGMRCDSEICVTHSRLSQWNEMWQCDMSYPQSPVTVEWDVTVRYVLQSPFTMEWEVTVRHVLAAVAFHNGMRGDSATCVSRSRLSQWNERWQCGMCYSRLSQWNEMWQWDMRYPQSPVTVEWDVIVRHVTHSHLIR